MVTVVFAVSVAVATTSADRTPVSLAFKVATSTLREFEVKTSVPLTVKVESVVGTSAACAAEDPKRPAVVGTSSAAIVSHAVFLLLNISSSRYGLFGMLQT
jgi:hypothetical protein